MGGGEGLRASGVKHASKPDSPIHHSLPSCPSDAVTTAITTVTATGTAAITIAIITFAGLRVMIIVAIIVIAAAG